MIKNEVGLRRDLEGVLRLAAMIGGDVQQEVEELVRQGEDAPLPRDEAVRLLTRILETVRNRSLTTDPESAQLHAINLRDLANSIVTARERLLASPSAPPPDHIASRPTRLQLEAKFGIVPGPVFPKPVFHEREVAMDGGFVRTKDVSLWENNERLEIHLAQFRQKEGRSPNPEELLDIMLSRLALPGIPVDGKSDQFKIKELARSIAVNGVQKAPILAKDSRLLDGNRRIAACHYVLHSDEFDSKEKQRAEWIYVWQLTEHATTEEEEAVVVALNFEPDHKEPWPEYVKAKKVYGEWQAMLALEPRKPSASRQADLKRKLSTRFALGPDGYVVNRYLKMVSWATDFEDYQVGACNKNEYEVKHVASRYFQYFDELAKGEKSGVANTLLSDEAYKHLVYDLLFQGKFSSWRQIRELRKTYEIEDARDSLKKAREEKDVEEAENYIDNAIAIARSKSAENRQLGANVRIDTFVKWLEDLPVNAFRDTIKPAILQRLLDALLLVQKAAEAGLEAQAGE